MAAKILKTVAPGIYQLQGGSFRVKVAVGSRSRGGQQQELQFPPGTGQRVMKDWQVQTRAALKRQRLVPARGTLRADIPTYISRMSNLAFPDSRKREIDAWLERFGERKRHTIKRIDVAAQVNDWQRAGAAASTIRHRLSALSMLYKVLDGPEGDNPVRGVTRPSEPRPRPGGPTIAAVSSVLDALIGRVVKNNRGWDTLARLRLIATTGMRHSQVMRLTREDFVLNHSPAYVVVADPGKDGEPHIKPLSEEGVDAARLFLRVGCFGQFSQQSVYKSWKSACEDAGVPFFNPYKLRHSYATALRSEGMDLADVQILLGHKSARTTQRYAAIAPHKVERAAAMLNDAWNRERGQTAWATPQTNEKKAAPDN